MTVSQIVPTVEENTLDELLTTLFNSTAEALAAETGFIRRKREVTGPAFAKALVFGWLEKPDASYPELQEMLAAMGCTISQQALEQRMTPAAADFLLNLLYEAMGTCLEGREVMTELLHRFEGVYVQDGTIIGLPNELDWIYRGCGGNTAESGKSALRVQMRLNLINGAMKGWIQEATDCEREGAGSIDEEPLPPNALYLVDSHYPTLRVMKQLSDQQVWWLTHLKADFVITDARGVRYDVPQFIQSRAKQMQIDERVRVGCQKETQQWVRVIAFRVSDEIAKKRREKVNTDTSTRGKGSRRDGRVGKKRERPNKDGRHRRRVGKKRMQIMEWTILVTNVPQERLEAHEARVLMRARWQIELLWRLWKERGQVDIWRSEKPMRILCEVYAKLLGLLVQHWMLVRGCWHNPWRSLVKASHAVRMLAPSLALTLTGEPLTVKTVLQAGERAMQKACIDRSRQHTSTARLLQQPERAKSLS